ncbi:hypothetical protein J437_LFUL001865, partial [Ladona fulva]
METDEVETPVHRTLYRQSSVEQRLYPSTPDPESEDEIEDEVFEKEEESTVILPRIVHVTPKSCIHQDGSSVIGKEEVKEQSFSAKNLESPSIKTKNETPTDIQIPDTSKENTVYEKEETEKRECSSATGNSSSETKNELVDDHQASSIADKSEDVEEDEIPSEENLRKTVKIIQENQVSTDNQLPVGFAAASMASPRPKSPRPISVKKDDKEESFWEKIGTLGRKKRIKEVQEVQEEGKHAIDSPGSPTAPDVPPEEYTLEENEERSMIEPRSYEDPKLRELIAVLIEWINDELADQRIIVKDIEEDLYDGQVLQKLLEKLTGEKLDVPEVTQSEDGQKQKLEIVLGVTNKVLGLPRWTTGQWSVESVHSKNVVAILHLLVALARHFRAPVRLPENVVVAVVVVQKKDGTLIHRTVQEEITSTYDDLGMRCERDAFDTLFDHAPDKLQVVKKSLVTFVNKHLSRVNLEVTELETQFHDGVYLTLLMGLLEGFFVPLYEFHLTPRDFDQKVQNVVLAFQLMQDVGLARPKARPEDIVNLDMKSTLRVLYNLFTKYK